MTSDDRPRLSVVVVALDALPHVLTSLSTLRGREAVVVDVGSTDGTPERIADAFPEAIVLRAPNRGYGAAANAGLARATGDRLLLLNGDAWVHPGALERLLEVADARPDAAVVAPRLVFPDGSPQPSIRGFPTPWRLGTNALMLDRLFPRSPRFNGLNAGLPEPSGVSEVEFVRGACLLLSRAAVEAIGSFDETFFMYGEEADLCFRLREAGWTTLYVPDAVCAHVSEASTSRAWSRGRYFRELERGQLRFVVKHHGPRAGERARRVRALGYRLRAVAACGERGRAYAATARWLRSARTPTLLETADGPVAP